MKMVGIIPRFGNWLSEVGPRLVAGLTFLPCGLLMGYTLSSFILRKTEFIHYGPLIIGILSAFLTSSVLCILKVVKNKIIFCHFDILLAAAVINIIGSILFFIDKLDHIGAFISYLAYGMTFISATSYLNIISGKNTRSIFLSSCFVWYIIGLSSAVSLIGHSFQTVVTSTTANKLIEPIQNSTINNIKLSFLNTDRFIYSKDQILPENLNGIYTNFGGVYLGVTLVITIFIILIKVFHFMSNLNYKESLDKNLHVANSNGSIFDKRDEILKKIQFFYVTKSKQWLISFILLFCDAIHFSLFIYFLSWFSLNNDIRLTKDTSFDLILWIVFLGSLTILITLIFFSIKVIFITSTILQIFFACLGMIIYIPNDSVRLIPFWLVLFLYGINFSNIKVSIIETSHFKYSELLVCISCSTKILAIAIINEFFISNSKISLFYSDGQGTLVAHGLAFIVISALITIIVSIQVPKTFKTSLFDIQYNLLGMIFKEHEIEQLNDKWLKDGTIPTVTRNVETC